MFKRMTTLGLLAALSGCDGTTDPDRQPVTTASVTVVDNRFDPGANRVAPNETVTWTWQGNNPHNVTFDDPSIGNSVTQADGTFSKSFQNEGEYTYFCTVHGRSVMSGAVVVGDGSASEQASGGGY